MTHTMYMIVTRDKFQFPLYWGETLGGIVQTVGARLSDASKGI